MRRVMGVAIGLMLAGAATAQTLNGKAAKAALFPPQGAEAEMHAEAGLPQDQVALLKTVAEGQPYYGAIAISPAEGLMSEATVAAANHHSVEAATVAALASCNARRKAEAPCAVAALIRPTGWEARPLQLSAEASAGFAKDYPRRKGAMAVSASTGAWGIAKGAVAAEAAVAACKAKNAAATDCTLLIAD